MRNFRDSRKHAIALIAVVLALGLFGFLLRTGGLPTATAQAAVHGTPPGIQRAMEVQERHTRALMEIPDVVGTAVGLTDDDRPAVLVLAKGRPGAGTIPDSLEDVPVIIRETGEIFAMKPPAGKGGKGSTQVDPTGWFARPVPIGVSTGNVGECSAGTIGARVKDSAGRVYALSNNHVYALENTAPDNSNVLQPGRYDTNCAIDLNNVVGQLSDYSIMRFDGSPNYIDAAIAISDTATLGNSTPANGYGRPKTTVVAAQVNDAVQKYGRTTGLTKGVIDGINATVNVSYENGVATFVNQIVITSRKPFINAGDSGSLVVTDPGRNPVGLVFAGNSSGKYAVANRIDVTLGAFGVTIDGE